MMYDFQELFTVVFPALDTLRNLGCIPKPEEVVEFSEQMYKMYEETYSAYGEIHRPLFTITRKRMKGKAERVSVLGEEQVEDMFKAIEILGDYAITKDVAVNNERAFLRFLEQDFHPMEMLREIDAVVTGYTPMVESEEGEVGGFM